MLTAARQSESKAEGPTCLPTSSTQPTSYPLSVLPDFTYVNQGELVGELVVCFSLGTSPHHLHASNSAFACAHLASNIVVYIHE
jgi:hypothetical protein